MAITWEDLQEYLGEAAGPDAVVKRCFDLASVLVTKFIGDETVPEVIVDDAILLVGQQEYLKRSAATGQVTENFATQDGIAVTPVRLARDPMAPAYKLLRPWVLPWKRVTDE